MWSCFNWIRLEISHFSISSDSNCLIEQTTAQNYFMVPFTSIITVLHSISRILKQLFKYHQETAIYVQKLPTSIALISFCLASYSYINRNSYCGLQSIMVITLIAGFFSSNSKKNTTAKSFLNRKLRLCYRFRWFDISREWIEQFFWSNFRFHIWASIW